MGRSQSGSEQDGYAREDARIQAYEMKVGVRTESQTELGYRHMNSRILEQEKEMREGMRLSIVSWKDALKNHLRSKKEIETAWKKNTVITGDTIRKKLVEDARKCDSYSDLELKELEVLLKNSDRGGNSELYNSVVTDLELLNSMEKKADDTELEELLANLAESCEKYLSKRNPFFSKGKIRKAMIEQVSRKVKEKLDRHRGVSEDTQADAMQMSVTQVKKAMYDSCNARYLRYKTTNDAGDLKEAVREHFELIQKSLCGQYNLDDKERAQLDRQMAEMVTALKTLPVEEDQSNTLSTRFFTAIGWSDRVPELVSSRDEFDAAVQASPLKKPMYHSINHVASTGLPDAVSLAEQLIGKGGRKQYLSHGMYGKGTYLAVNNEGSDYTEKRVSDHCWEYGKAKGSVQLNLCFNQNMRLIDDMELRRRKSEIQDLFPKLHGSIKQGESSFGSGWQTTKGEQDLSMFAALLGYNTVRCLYGDLDGKIGYCVTCDRSVLTVMDTITRRDGGGAFSTVQISR